MLCLALLLEMLQWRSRRTDLNSAISITLNVSLLASLCAVATGWFLAEEGGYDADLIFWHKWLGIGMTTLLALICTLRWRNQEQRSLPLLIVTVLLLFGAGHFGGSITHGEDYLFSKGNEEKIIVENIQEAPVFTSIIQPILKQKCMSCHNPSKQKGGLLMTTIEGLKAGGEKGKLIDFNLPMKSALLTRIHLPKAEKEHMPPSGKKQLTDDEILLLEWWVKHKACFDCKVSELKQQESVAAVLDKYTGRQKAKLKTLPFLSAIQLTTLKASGIPVQQLAVDNPYVIVNLAGKKDLDKQTFKELRKIGDYILELNLQNSNLSDQLATWLEYFSNLQKLQIQNTTISNKSIPVLKNMKQLESLNIYGTAISDEAIPIIKSLPALQRLYCWQSKMTANGVQQIQKSKPLLQIQYKMDEDLFGGAILNKPSIKITTDLFVDTVHVRLKSSFKGAAIYYTLDESDPDSTSLLYQDSINVATSLTLKSYCYKKGWTSSEVRTTLFRKTGVAFKSMKLSTPPSDDYKGKGGLTLMDRVHGSSDLKDGNWLGYQGKNLILTAELDSAQQIAEVALRAMSSPGPWLFFPKKLKVSTSTNGKDFKLAGQGKYDFEERDNFRIKKYFEINFEPRLVRYIRMEITSYGKLPEWHPEAGKDSWLFIDEVAAE